MTLNNTGIAAKAAAVAACMFYNKRVKKKGSRKGSRTRTRSRRSVEDLLEQLGEIYFRRAFRMPSSSFQALHSLIKYGIIAHSQRDIESSNYRPNGPISTSVRLGCALRYFAGGSPYDIGCSFGISQTEVFESISHVINAINDRFPLSYPSSHAEQLAIADDFQPHSQAEFAICAGAIDGLLIWIGKPTPLDCKEMKCDSGKFFCGRKHKFGLNCQAVSDRRGRILEVFIMYPGSTSDCLAFEGSTLYQKLKSQGFLAPGLCLFGNNAYLNAPYMATPYTGGAAGSVDAYNFYHSQLRIRVECAFGMLTERWAILRSAIPRNMSVKKTIALVCALARLHNFCINQVDEGCLCTPSHIGSDALRNEERGAVPLVAGASTVELSQGVPVQLMGGGHHFDDYDRNTRRQFARQYQGELLPRERLFHIIDEIGLRRPQQMAS